MIIKDLFFTFLLTASFAILFNIRGKHIIYSSIGGCISSLVYLLAVEHKIPTSGAYALATGATAIYCEIVARKIKTTVPTLLVAALIRLAPGGGIYYTILYHTQNRHDEAFLKGIETSIVAMSMALGIMVILTISRVLTQRKLIKLEER